MQRSAFVFLIRDGRSFVPCFATWMIDDPYTALLLRFLRLDDDLMMKTQNFPHNRQIYSTFAISFAILFLLRKLEDAPPHLISDDEHLS